MFSIAVVCVNQHLFNMLDYRISADISLTSFIICFATKINNLVTHYSNL